MFPGPGFVDVTLPYFQDLVWGIVGVPFPKMMVALETQNGQKNEPHACVMNVSRSWACGCSATLVPGPGMGHCWGALPENDGGFGGSK